MSVRPSLDSKHYNSNSYIKIIAENLFYFSHTFFCNSETKCRLYAIKKILLFSSIAVFAIKTNFLIIPLTNWSFCRLCLYASLYHPFCWFVLFMENCQGLTVGIILVVSLGFLALVIVIWKKNMENHPDECDCQVISLVDPESHNF